MEALANDNLFLLEFLIEDVDIFSDEDDVPCVSLNFMKAGPFYIESDKCCNKSLKHGKSILFSLTPELIECLRTNFLIEVNLNKCTGCRDMVCVGGAVLRMDCLFGELLEKVMSCGPPAAKTVKKCFGVEDEDGVCAGKVSSYVRISCFGKFIVTTFHMNLESEGIQYCAEEKDEGEFEGPLECPVVRSCRDSGYTTTTPSKKKVKSKKGGKAKVHPFNKTTNTKNAKDSKNNKMTKNGKNAKNSMSGRNGTYENNGRGKFTSYYPPEQSACCPFSPCNSDPCCTYNY